MCQKEEAKTENKNEVTIPAEILEAVKIHLKTADDCKGEMRRLERKRSIARDSMFALIEEELPELTEKCYRVDTKKGVLIIKDHDHSEGGIGEMIKDMILNK